MNRDVILTGIRSNDEPTIGNYLGAFLPMVELQQKFAGEYQVNMFVPDLHSFTTPIDHAQLYANTIKNLKYFIAAGLAIENEDTFIYRQSFIPAHSELTWILDCFTYMGEMQRMTQFKEKTLQSSSSGTAENSVSVGLFNYPVLMAADILLYNAKWVPVGDDQKQHIEIARDLGLRLNNKFGEELFIVPEEWKKQLAFAKRDNGVRIRSLVNPEKKMSKSIADPRGTILLSDDPAVAAKKVMGATTDSVGSINFDWDTQPGISNLLQMLALMSGQAQEDINRAWTGNERYGDLKKAVAEATEAFLADFQSRYQSVDESALLAKLEASEAAMNEVASSTLLRVQKAVGLRA
ncbi:tryptophan--tRNA ligase [Candidatus Saccharibacteria bacterium]|nr:MAG: tryptophan--tRNA ligase [Candidatus Saccharibacteria bacterium]